MTVSVRACDCRREKWILAKLYRELIHKKLVIQTGELENQPGQLRLQLQSHWVTAGAVTAGVCGHHSSLSTGSMQMLSTTS